MSVPDLKEAEGGIRDATVLKSLTATWMVDIPAADLERSRQQLLDVRDLLHAAAGRASDRIAPEQWSAARRGDGAAGRPRCPAPGPRAGPPDHPPVAAGLASRRRRAATYSRRASRDAPTSSGSHPALRSRWARSCSTGAPSPASDAVLLLRAAAEAARRNVVLAPPTAARLVRECPPLPDPWPEEARHEMVRLLAAGPGLLAVWETLEETGALERILPEWERIRLLPHASVIHRFTVDRHVVETCIEASALIREVSRPDVLLVVGAAPRHRQGRRGRAQRRRRADRPGDRDPDGFRSGRGRPDRAAGAVAPAAGDHGDHPRPGGPGDGRAAHRARPDTRGARPADRPHRGGREGDLGQGVVVVAGRPDPRPVPTYGRRPRTGQRGGRDRRGRDRDPCCRTRRLARDHGRGGRRRLARHHGVHGPRRAARRLRRDVRAAAPPGACRADLGAGGVRRRRVGRGRRPPGRGAVAQHVRLASPTAGSIPQRGWVRAPTGPGTTSRPRSSYDPRPATRRP